ncbi:MAG: D-alpha,beta-D-heptose 1,7-bisphosphate phosphatase [Magnetococcales bacterium]|nr:D-alpha,beta-D-heptose 1,7-bisphosphate phosphatase [Magnetococcales bacterium]HIJ83244.1 HAD family hydrolase [Magnetococcales bacterium]
MRYRAVFFDRDGVLNRPLIRDGKGYAPRTLDAFEIYPEAPAALQTLKEAGFKIVVVTNQPDIGHGLVSAEEVALMHQRLHAAMPVDLILTCPHRQTDGCLCRKPKPGMLETAIQKLAIDPGASFLVGDRSSDIAAGLAVGCRTIFIDRQYREPVETKSDFLAQSVLEAAQWIINGLFET